MSLCYWSICGVGICAEDIYDYLDKEKLANFLYSEITDGEEAERLRTLIYEQRYDEVCLEDYFDNYAFDSLAEILYACDSTKLLTYGEDEDGMSYLFYPSSMPWQRRNDEPENLKQVHDIIINAVQKISSLSRKEIERMIDDDIDIICSG